MNKIRLSCVKCNNKLCYVSSSGSSMNDTIKEVWECMFCKYEVMVTYERKDE